PAGAVGARGESAPRSDPRHRRAPRHDRKEKLLSGEHIRIGDVEPRIQYVADGAQTVFTFPFPIFAPGDLAVHLDALPQTEGFEVLGAGADEGGSVVFASAPASGVRVTLRRALAIRRQTDFQEGGE